MLLAAVNRYSLGKITAGIVLSIVFAAEATGTETSASLVATVRAIPPAVLAPRPSSQVSKEFLQAYYESIRQWGRIVGRQVRPVPGRQGQDYLGLPRNVENDVRSTAYAAMVLSFLAAYQPPQLKVEPSEREKWRESAIGLLRYLTAAHVSGDGACLNGQPWGNQWQSAMWARATGLAGWFLWPELDKELQTGVARLVESEADRFLRQPPKSSLSNDTGAEENAWNALITSLACNMMPSHPRAKAWEESSLRYLYNTFSVAADAQDAAPGDWSRPVKDWVATVNAHDDFTVENHGIVHIGYLKNTASELQENALHWLMAGRKAPRACMHHELEVFDLLIHCMAWDGAPVFFAGNDWKLYHSQSSDIVLYAMLSLLQSDRRAAFLEKTAWKWLLRQQQAEKGYFNVRRDLEYGGLCSTRLIACCLAHGLKDTPPEPISAAEFDRLAGGTRHLVSSKTVVHRTADKFASFTWAQKRMALALPRDGNWVIWPHFASYLGIINGQDSSQRRARLKHIHVDLQPEGFRVSGTLQRCGGKLVQNFFYASPAAAYTVYIERLQAAGDFQLESRETGIIGLEYPLDSNQRSLYGPWGALKTTGYGGPAQIRKLQGNWLNIDNCLGYVICRSNRRKNLIRHHDENRGSGRVPQLQEWISLVGEEAPESLSAPSWACVVTFLNQTAQETADWASRVQLTVKGNQATCTLGKETFTADFSPKQEPQEK